MTERRRLEEIRTKSLELLTSAQHLLQLINDVLDLAKVEAGKMKFRREPIDPARLAAEVRDTPPA